MFQGREEPFQDEGGTLGGVGLSGWSCEDGRMGGPVGGEFGEGLGRENERGRGEG